MRLSSWRPAVVAVLAVAATTVTPLPGSASSLMTTTVHQVTPLDANGHLRSRYTVTTSARGYCWTSSFMHGRSYRCLKGNSIMDPCWKEAGRNSVVCLLRPWSTNVTRLRLTKRLPAKEDSAGVIWGLRLGGGVGVRCQVASGAGGWIGNRHISYYCGQGWVLVGNPDRRQAVWAISTAKRVGDHYDLRGRKPLTDAWRPIVG